MKVDPDNVTSHERLPKMRIFTAKDYLLGRAAAGSHCRWRTAAKAEQPLFPTSAETAFLTLPPLSSCVVPELGTTNGWECQSKPGHMLTP